MSCIVFRVSTNSHYGLGHLVRLMALRSFFHKPVHWFVDPKSLNLVRKKIPKKDKILEENSCKSIKKAISFCNEFHAKAFICDSYNISLNELDKCKTKVFYFIDSPNKTLKTNIVYINCQPYRSLSKFSISGVNYFPINTEGRRQKKINFSDLTFPINCLISFGTVDSKNLTSYVLSAILSDQKLKTLLNPICLLGPYFQYKKEVKSLLNKFNDYTLFLKCNSILELGIQCPIAIGLPGVSQIERLYCGFATTLIWQKSYHHKLALNWERMGLALSASLSISQINSAIHKMVNNDFQIAKKISFDGQKLVDGNGGKRLAKKILSY